MSLLLSIILFSHFGYYCNKRLLAYSPEFCRKAMTFEKVSFIVSRRSFWLPSLLLAGPPTLAPWADPVPTRTSSGVNVSYVNG